MPQPTTRDVHVDVALTTVSVKYQNATFVGEKLFTPILVNKDSDIYFIYGKQDFRIFNTIRAPGTRAKQVEWTIEKSAPYFTKEHSLEMQLIDEVRNNADDPIQYDADSTEILTNMLLLDLEKNIADVAQDPNSYAPEHSETLSETDKWSDYTSSNPLKKVRDMKETIRNKIFLYPNTMIVSADVHNVLLDHPVIVDRIKYTQLGVTTEQLLARLFEIDNYLIAGGGYISSAEGQEETLTNIWNNCVVLAYVAPRPGLKQISFGYLFRRKGYRMVERWRDDPLRSDWIRVSDKYDIRVISPYAGYLLQSVV
jgi:hypothetical protein